MSRQNTDRRIIGGRLSKKSEGLNNRKHIVILTIILALILIVVYVSGIFIPGGSGKGQLP